MKYAACVLLIVVSACSTSPVDTAWIPPAPSRIIDDVEWVAGNWEPHLVAGDKGISLGNHRAVVHVPVEASGTVQVSIPWRRLDSDPAGKAVIVVDSTSGEVLSHAMALSVTAESGEITFETVAGSSTYYVYYLPWESSGGYYPRITYLPPGESSWVPSADPSRVSTVRIESVNAFHSFFPMEIPATEAETNAFVAERDWLVVPEYGRYPIAMRHNIPLHWASGSQNGFVTSVYTDESHSFQLGVYAANTDLEDIYVSFDGLDPRLAGASTCFNCEGIQYTGEAFTTEINVSQGDVQPLWIGIQIPADMPSGDYPGQAIVSSSNAGAKTVDFTITVLDASIRNHGFDDPASQSRLAWLNSTVGRDQDFIIDPYTPVGIDNHTLSILGRDVELTPTGLPAAITSFFTEEMTSVAEEGAPIIAEPMMLFVQTGGASGSAESWTPQDFIVTQRGLGRAEWFATSFSESFALQVDGALEYDGMLDFRITLTATKDIEITDISLPVTYADEAATWILGLGHKGQKRPAQIDWQWNVKNHQEGLWMGAVNKGLQYVLRDDNYERPLNTNFYQNQPLNLPVSWDNGGKGGIRMVETAHGITLENYSGPRPMAAGEQLHFNIRFLITPFRPLDTKTHFETRFVHKYVPVDSVVAWGGTVVNIHHANEINPYINYPFYNLEKAKAYIDEAHSKGIKVKLYNTIRELTYKAYELQAMRSLGEEIFNGGEGGGHSWLQEHLRENYHSAWHAFSVDDAAILNKGTSRWTNYYIEGLSWLAANQEIDGLYLDDIAFSRETVKRMISVLHADRDEVVIDLHSANQFNPADGHINSAMLYMEHFPFISRLWFGEYFDYDQPTDYWMTEVSGIPFGLMGEMLQGGGHPYRGMLYGMTTRMYGDVDPRPVWKMMNDFGIADSRMLGFWLKDAPLKTGNDLIKGTAFVRPDGNVMIALASWSDRDETVELTLNRELLGLSENATWSVPEVQGLQTSYHPNGPEGLAVPANQGLFVLLSPH